jgi:hypothetical protein
MSKVYKVLKIVKNYYRRGIKIIASFHTSEYYSLRFVCQGLVSRPLSHCTCTVHSSVGVNFGALLVNSIARADSLIYIWPTVVIQSYIIWDTTPCIPVEVSLRFGGPCRHHLQGRRISQARNKDKAAILTACFMLVPCLAYSSTVKMEATCSSETSINFHRNTLHYIPDVRILHNYRYENLKYCVIFCCFWCFSLVSLFWKNKMKGGLWDHFAMCVCVCVCPLTLLCNGSVNMFLRQRIHTQQ